MNFNFFSRRAMNGGKDPEGPPPDAEGGPGGAPGRGRRGRRPSRRRTAKMRMPASTTACRDWAAQIAMVPFGTLVEEGADLGGRDADQLVAALVVTATGRCEPEAEFELVRGDIQDTPTIFELRLTSVSSPFPQAREQSLRYLRAIDDELAQVQRVVINGAVALDVERPEIAGVER